MADSDWPCTIGDLRDGDVFIRRADGNSRRQHVAEKICGHPPAVAVKRPGSDVWDQYDSTDQIRIIRRGA